MTKPANSHNKPSPADTPTHRPHDNGHKSIVGNDEDYTRHKLEKNSIALKRENEEQPVSPVKDPPKEKGMENGKVQP